MPVLKKDLELKIGTVVSRRRVELDNKRRMGK